MSKYIAINTAFLVFYIIFRIICSHMNLKPDKKPVITLVSTPRTKESELKQFTCRSAGRFFTIHTLTFFWIPALQVIPI